LKLEKSETRIQNVVTSAALKHSIDLDAIAKTFPHVKYQPKVSPGLAFRLKRPKTCTLIFNTGRMVCTGAKSEKDARGAIMKDAKELKAAGIIITGEPEYR
jgi:transcription initiation factor TFIID TATA-box-binding protein